MIRRSFGVRAAAALQLLLFGGQLEVAAAGSTTVKSQAQLDEEIKARLAC